MENADKFKVFMDRVLQRPLPNNPMARIRTLAKELAEGATEEIWSISILADRGHIMVTEVLEYLSQRWKNEYPKLELLFRSGYLSADSAHIHINHSALQLLEEVESSTIFISYKRTESSAFALLVLARLKINGLDAHLDMAIQPGDNWHAHLKEEIQKRDYFILLLGNESLSSEVVCKEILWSLEAGATIIPIWHNEFQYRGQSDLDPRIDEVLRNTHTIRVTDESALGYETALIELLNFFGVTP